MRDDAEGYDCFRAETASSIRFWLEDDMVTRAPSSIAASAVAKPIPELPPTTSTWAFLSLSVYLIWSGMALLLSQAELVAC